MKRVILMVSLSLFPRLLAAQQFDVAPLIGETWYGLYLNGQKSGYSVQTVKQDADGVVRVGEDARFRITMEGIKQDMRIFSERAYSPEGNLKTIDMSVDTINGPSQFNAVVKGDKLLLRTVVGGVPVETSFPVPKESLRDAFKQIELTKEGAKVGDELTYSVFEPMYQKEIGGVSRIVAVEDRVFDGAPTKVFKVETTLKEVGIDSISYVAEDGTTLEDVVAGMITTRLEPKEIAQDVNYSNDVIVSNAALLEERIAKPRSRTELKLHITGPLKEYHLFADERQHFTPKEDGFEFSAVQIAMEDSTPATLPIANPGVAQWIEPSVFIQSADPKLQAKAKEIVADEKDSFKVSSELCHWVYDNVRTTFSAQLSNALEVLEHLEGDCTEHSVLFIGLARAAGLPAREVAGLIYVDSARPGFYFHQWATVWVGKWIDVDPTFNQPLADVTHIKLAEGDLFQQAKLIPIIGQIQIEVAKGGGE